MPSIFSSLPNMPKALGLLTIFAVSFIIIQYQVSISWTQPTFNSRIISSNSNNSTTSTPKPVEREAPKFNDLNLDYELEAQVQRIAMRAINHMKIERQLTKYIDDKLVKKLAFHIARHILVSTNCVERSLAVVSNFQSKSSKKVPIYVVTPTYKRPEQIPELTRLSQTLMNVENLHWVVVEDAENRTTRITNFLRKTPIKFHHLIAPMPIRFKRHRGAKPKGVSNRNKAIQWAKQNLIDGVMYFADDDNTYDLELFEQMRNTKKVSMWPVGLCTKTGLSSPVVKNGKFAGFYDGWIAGRKFPVDMAGFAVSIKFLRQRPKASMPYKPGFEEDGFLRSLAPFEPNEIELKADNCTKILVWHTQTKKNEISQFVDKQKFGDSNIMNLKELI